MLKNKKTIMNKNIGLSPYHTGNFFDGVKHFEFLGLQGWYVIVAVSAE